MDPVTVVEDGKASAVICHRYDHNESSGSAVACVACYIEKLRAQVIEADDKLSNTQAPFCPQCQRSMVWERHATPPAWACPMARFHAYETYLKSYEAEAIGSRYDVLRVNIERGMALSEIADLDLSDSEKGEDDLITKAKDQVRNLIAQSTGWQAIVDCCFDLGFKLPNFDPEQRTIDSLLSFLRSLPEQDKQIAELEDELLGAGETVVEQAGLLSEEVRKSHRLAEHIKTLEAAIASLEKICATSEGRARVSAVTDPVEAARVLSENFWQGMRLWYVGRSGDATQRPLVINHGISNSAEYREVILEAENAIAIANWLLAKEQIADLESQRDDLKGRLDQSDGQLNLVNQFFKDGIVGPITSSRPPRDSAFWFEQAQGWHSRVFQLKAAINEVVTQKLDDLCWIEVFTKLGALVGVEFKPELLPRGMFLNNCSRFFDSLHGGTGYVKDEDVLLAGMELAAQAMCLICRTGQVGYQGFSADRKPEIVQARWYHPSDGGGYWPCSAGSIHEEIQKRRRAKPEEKTATNPTRASFAAYCAAHPTLRFWQALRDWSGYRFIFGSHAIASDDRRALEDTFYLTER